MESVRATGCEALKINIDTFRPAIGNKFGGISGPGIKPIIGNEMYVINGSIEDPQPKKERRYHLVVLAKNAVGYRNLVKLTSISHLRGMRGRGIFARACIDKQLLKQYSEGLIVATACLGGEIPQAILRGRPDAADQADMHITRPDSPRSARFPG